MTKQQLTFYPDYTIKSYKEYFDGVLMCYTKYNIKGNAIYTKTPMDEFKTKDGKLHGKYNHYNREGKLRFKLTYKNGKKHGWKYIYCLSGELSEKMYYEDDKINGKYFSYYRNGIVFTEHNYVNNVIHGPAFVNNFDGNLYIERIYENNKEVYKKTYEI